MTAALLALALAHESGVSSSRLERSGDGVRVTFTFSLEDLAGLARLDANRDGLVDAAEWAHVLPAIHTYVGEHFRIEGCRSEGETGTLPATLRIQDLRMPVTLAYRYLPSTPLDRLQISCDLFREHGGNPRHIAELPGGETIVFDGARREADCPLARRSTGRPLIAAALLSGFLVMVGAAMRRILRIHERPLRGPAPAIPILHRPHSCPGISAGGSRGGDPDSAAELPGLGL